MIDLFIESLFSTGLFHLECWCFCCYSQPLKNFFCSILGLVRNFLNAVFYHTGDFNCFYGEKKHQNEYGINTQTPVEWSVAYMEVFFSCYWIHWNVWYFELRFNTKNERKATPTPTLTHTHSNREREKIHFYTHT